MGMTEDGASFQMSGKPEDPKDGGDRKGWPGHVLEWEALEGCKVGHTRNWKSEQGCGLGNERKPTVARHEALGREQRQEVKRRKSGC